MEHRFLHTRLQAGSLLNHNVTCRRGILRRGTLVAPRRPLNNQLFSKLDASCHDFPNTRGFTFNVEKKFSTCCLLPFQPPLPERTLGKPSGFPTCSFGNMVWKIVSLLSLRYWNTYCFNSHKTNEGSPFQVSDIYFSHILYQPYDTVSLSYKLICILQGIRSEGKGRPASFHRLKKHNLLYFRRFMSY